MTLDEKKAHTKEYFRKRYLNNREHFLIQCRERYQRTKPARAAWGRNYYLKNKEAISARTKAYTAKNAVRNRLKAKLYAQQNPERVKAYKKKWQDAHKHENLMRAKARRAKIKLTKDESEVASQFYKWIRNQDFVTCTYCGVFVTGKSVEVDHIVPVSRGGHHVIDNFCVCCSGCNKSKANKLLSEWTRCPEKFRYN